MTTGKLVTTWTRDLRGLPTSMTDPDGAVTGYSYDEAGELALTTDPMVTTETYGNAPVTAYPLTRIGYDTFGDVTQTKDAGGNVTTYAYDADGRQVSKTLPPYTPPGGSPVTAVYTTGYDGDGNVTSTSDGIGNTTKYTYDQLGDQVTATAPDGSGTTTAYDADRQPLSVTGPTGAQTQTTWDYLGRKLTSTQIERDSGSGTAAYTTNYTYDDSSTGGGFLSQVTSPDGVSTKYSYDPTGAVASVTDGAGNGTSYSYDSLGRQVQVAYPDGTSTVTGYDGAGNVRRLRRPGHRRHRVLHLRRARPAHRRPAGRAGRQLRVLLCGQDRDGRLGRHRHLHVGPVWHDAGGDWRGGRRVGGAGVHRQPRGRAGPVRPVGVGDGRIAGL